MPVLVQGPLTVTVLLFAINVPPGIYTIVAVTAKLFTDDVSKVPDATFNITALNAPETPVNVAVPLALLIVIAPNALPVPEPPVAIDCAPVPLNTTPMGGVPA
ncbi:MAG: hypothetical protein IPI64_10440 [Chloracidobacterium sp.]|nr:hypothetical protein [Chloracidobacterium sp.]